MGRSVILELHGWRGFHIEGGALGRVLVVGFVSVSYVPYLLTDWLKERVSKLRSVAAPARVEMACAGEAPYERINHGKPLRVPSGRK